MNPDVMVSAQADATSAEVGAIVREGALAQTAVEALSDIAQQMLRCEGLDLMATALRRIFDVVPSAQRVTVAKWPPDPVLGLRSLLPEAVLRREGLPRSPVSASMARYAVESGNAVFFFQGSSQHAAVSDAPSVVLNRIQTAIYVPLIAREEILGVLCVDTPAPEMPLTRDDFPFIRAIGALLAAALHADQLREETRRRQLEAREVTAQRAAMSDSLQVAAHDLKNPLSVIMMAAYAADHSEEPAERSRLIEQISDAARRARSLVDTYLEAARQTSAEATPSPSFKTHRSQVNPRMIVDEEIAFIGEATEATNRPVIANKVRCEALAADPAKLRQIFTNLLSNSIKYAPIGREVIVESEETDRAVVFRVVDHGAGIPAEERERIFDPFQRIGDTTAREGSGLGLWITRGLVEAHRGEIRVEPTAGGGATFVFWLPKETDPPERTSV
ncbi:MAG: HAMP domain-containing histidine kinase [Armatimonadetes bacterium]|nr:HAMP domain-containing histidine kinase [Armatimonadota bacterium]